VESQIKTKYPPSFREFQSKVTLLLRHKPPTQPALMTYIPHKCMKSIKPICNAKKIGKYLQPRINILACRLISLFVVLVVRLNRKRSSDSNKAYHGFQEWQNTEARHIASVQTHHKVARVYLQLYALV
jgi:hypothetical protein